MNKKIETKDKKIEDKQVDLKKSSSFKKKKKIKKNITSGIAYVYSTFNNTIVSIADENGNVVPLLYSQYTKSLLSDIDSIEVDKIKVKGKEELITIYKPSFVS